MLASSSKFLTITYKALKAEVEHTHLTIMIYRHTPSRTLRSATGNLVATTRANLSSGANGLGISAPTVCNSILVNIRSSENSIAFRRLLKMSSVFQSY